MIRKTKVVFCEEPEAKEKKDRHERRAIVEYILNGVYITIVDDKLGASAAFKFAPIELAAAVKMVCEAEGVTL